MARMGIIRLAQWLILLLCFILSQSAIAAEKRFVQKGEGLVLDTKTNLMWAEDAGAPEYNAPIQIANTIVQEMNSGRRRNFGHTDWRIPTLDELRSLVDEARSYPALPEGHPFRNVQPDFYWTSTGGFNLVGYAWAVDLSTGAVKYDYASYCTFHWFWPVRSAGKVKLEHKAPVATAPSPSELGFLVREDSCREALNEKPPSSPKDITAVAVSPEEVILSWKDGRAEGLWYLVYDAEGKLVRSVQSPPVSITGLAPGSEACFTVRASLGSGLESPASAKECARTWAEPAQGTVWSVGLNNYGQLGDGTRTDNTRVIQTKGLANIVHVSSGVEHAAAVGSDGSLWVWGSNARGQLGDGSTKARLLPVKLGLSNITGISLGWYHSAAMTSEGRVFSWGRNYYNQLGDGTDADRQLPVEVTSLPPVKKLAAGWYHTLALLRGGTVMAWGWDLKGQLGTGEEKPIKVPAEVQRLSSIKDIAAGMYHSLALGSDGTVWAWGSNEFGQLGDGTMRDAHLPVQVNGLGKVLALAGGMNYSLALLEDGTVWAWGRNDYGQLGSVAEPSVNKPIKVARIDGVKAIAAGAHHALALKSDGSLWLWGWDYSTGEKFSAPHRVGALSGFTHVSAGVHFTTALRGQ